MSSAAALSGDNENENITDLNSLGTPISSLLAYCSTGVSPVAYCLVVIDPISYCWNGNGCVLGLGKEHSILAG